MPPSFISPPLLFAWICCWGIFISNLRPPRPLQLWRMRGRLELTVPPYIWSLATYWPAIHRPSDWLRGGRLVASWWLCENCIAFSDCTHCVPSLIILCPAELSHYELHRKPYETVTNNSAVAVSLARSTARKGDIINGTSYHYSIISPPILVANLIGKKGGA